MKNYSVVILIFLLVNSVFAQSENDWRAEFKGKIQEEKQQGDMFFFRVGAKWGAFNATLQKVVAKPTFDFVYADHAGSLDTLFFVILKNKVGLYSNSGAVILKPGFTQLGFYNNHPMDYSPPTCFRANDKNYTLDTEGNSQKIQNFQTLKFTNDYATERAFSCLLEVKNDFLIVNNRSNEDILGYALYTINGDDSLDVNGNTVYSGASQLSYSGVYSFKEKKWKLEPIYQSVKKYGNYFLATRFSIDTLTSTFLVFDHAFNLVNQYSSYDKLSRDLNQIKLFIDPSVSEVAPWEVFFILQDFFTFKSDNKKGLYSLYRNEIIETANYDEIFYLVGKLSESRVMLKDGKLIPKIQHDNFTTQLAPCMFFATYIVNDLNNYSHKFFFQVDNRFFELNLKAENGMLQSCSFNPLAQPLIEKNIFSFQQEYLLIQSFVERGPEPTAPYMIVDAFGEVMDSVGGYDAMGNPLYAYPPPEPPVEASGIYHVKNKKFVLNRLYSNVSINENGFVGINQKLYLPTQYSFFNKSGVEQFSNKSAEELFTNKELIQKATVQSSAVAKENLYIGYLHLNILGNFFVIEQNGKQGVFDPEKMNWLIPCTFDKVIYSDRLYGYLVYDNDQIGIYSLTGKLIVPCKAKKITLIGLASALLVDDQWVTIIPYNNIQNVKLDVSALFVDMEWNILDFPDQSESHFRAEVNGSSLLINDWTFNQYYEEYDDFGNPIEVDPLNTFRSNSAVYINKGKQKLQMDYLTQIEKLGDLYLCKRIHGDPVLTDANLKIINASVKSYKKWGDWLYIFDPSQILGYGYQDFADSDIPMYAYHEPKVIQLFYKGNEIVWDKQYELIHAFSPDMVLGMKQNTEGEYAKPDYFLLRSDGKNWTAQPFLTKYEVLWFDQFKDGYKAVNTNLYTEEAEISYLKANNKKIDTIGVWNGKANIAGYTSYDSYPSFFTVGNNDILTLINEQGKNMISFSAKEGEFITINSKRYIIHTAEGYLLLNENGERLTNEYYEQLKGELFSIPQWQSMQSQCYLAEKGGKKYVLDYNGMVLKEFSSGKNESNFSFLPDFYIQYFYDGSSYYDVQQINGLPDFSKSNRWDSIIYFYNNAGANASIYLTLLTKSDKTEIRDNENNVIAALATRAYIEAEPFSNGLYFIYKPLQGTYDVFDVNDKKITSLNLRKSQLLSKSIGSDHAINFYFTFKESGKYGISRLSYDFKDFSSTVLIEPRYDTLIDRNGLLVGKQNNSYAVFKTAKNYERLPYIFTGFESFGNSPLQLFKKDKKAELWYYQSDYDTIYKWELESAINLKVESINNWGEESFKIYDQNKTGYWIPVTGFKVPCMYRELTVNSPAKGYYTTESGIYKMTDHSKIIDEGIRSSRLLNSQFLVQTASNKYILYSYQQTSPQTIVSEYEIIDAFVNQPYIIVRQNRKFSLMQTQTSKTVLPFEYDQLYYIPTDDSIYYAFKKNDKVGVFDKNFNSYIKPVYDSIANYSWQGIAGFMVWSNGKVGLIDRNGKSIIAPLYEDFTYYELEGISFFRVDAKHPSKKGELIYGICDKNGKLVHAPQFDDIEIRGDNNVLYNARKGQKWYIVKLDNPAMLVFDH